MNEETGICTRKQSRTFSDSPNSVQQLARAREVMRQRNQRLARQLGAMRTRNEKLEDIANTRSMDNFKLATSSNRVNNTFSNIDTLTKKCPGKLIKVSNNVATTLEVCSIVKSKGECFNGDKANNQVQPVTRSSTSKLNVVKPHTVNGHVLYAPTITLTRVAEPRPMTPEDVPSTSTPELENNGVHEDSNPEIDSFINEDFDMDENRPSTSTGSPQHSSTVLSGTFREVKFYMNRSTVQNSREHNSPSDTFRCPASTSGVTQRRTNSDRHAGGSR